ncbi:hypothetical protein B9G98_04484 [Wickerhamiella sorbophila]|uniref:Aminotransferase class I/classII large domain-containing protein n=1 Tax=Wickerhamiella sorbophila TaxID=45607 RepID=A0A2T0FPE9_9ASCO|nr:hypothetical protein B9G98_04484 [Wickerhamiella sorbophila]PRT56864.1 hypothetical protein B9G98_04484 [Wickerhamiella sorbophila]
MVVTFFRGHPTDRLLPASLILEAANRVLGSPKPYSNDEKSRNPLTYGPDEGSYFVRQQICKWYNGVLNGTATPECINLTNGASYGALIALLRTTSPQYTKGAYVVSPTYFLINGIFEDVGLRKQLRSLCEKDDGRYDLDALEAELAHEKESSPQKPSRFTFRYVLYLVPTHNNPSGHTVPLEDRKRLLEIARRYDLLILADEVYEWLNYTDKPNPTSLTTLDRETLPEGSIGNVIGNYTISKVLGPGLRVGWHETATPELAYHLSQLGSVKSGGTPAHLNTYFVGDMMESGAIDKVILNLNTVYGERAHAYRAAMEKYLPAGTKIDGGNGGYFFWLRFPNGYDIHAITQKCKDAGIMLAPGQHFEVTGQPHGWGDHHFRVSLSYHESDEATEAIKKWGEISQTCRK